MGQACAGMTTYAVFKYPGRFNEPVSIPKGARILSVGAQGHSLFLWAIVDVAAPLVNRRIDVKATGQQFTQDPGKYLGMVQHGNFVWHFFDDGESW